MQACYSKKTISVNFSDQHLSHTKRFVSVKYFKCIPFDARKCLKTICKICKTGGIKIQVINFIFLFVQSFFVATAEVWIFVCLFVFNWWWYVFSVFVHLFEGCFFSSTDRRKKIQLCSKTESMSAREWESSENVPILFDIYICVQIDLISGYL